MNCPCPKHPFGCYGHPNDCGCAERETSEIEWLRAEVKKWRKAYEEARNLAALSLSTADRGGS